MLGGKNCTRGFEPQHVFTAKSGLKLTTMEKKHKGLKADLHLHTCDCIKESTIDYNAFQLIDAAMEKGFEVLAITNHDTITYSSYLKDYAWERGILLIPGSELTIKKKHILAYNITDRVLCLENYNDLKKIKKKNNLFIAPHPFFPASLSLGMHLIKWQSLFDAVELSHFYTNTINFNKKAITIAEKLHLPMVGSSDSHLLCQLNTTYSVIYAEKDTEAVIEAVKNGAVKVVTSPLSTAKAGLILHEMFIRKSIKKVGAACFYLFSLLFRI